MEWDQLTGWTCTTTSGGTTLDEQKSWRIQRPLLLVAIAKIVDEAKLKERIRTTMTRTHNDPRQEDDQYYDLTWMKVVISDVRRWDPDSIGATSNLVWTNIRKTVLKWAQNELKNKREDKVEDVIDGRIPVYDLLEKD